MTVSERGQLRELETVLHATYVCLTHSPLVALHLYPMEQSSLVLHSGATGFIDATVSY